jgi:hypothetical protein
LLRRCEERRVENDVVGKLHVPIRSVRQKGSGIG